jgi:hypothetical protein
MVCVAWPNLGHDLGKDLGHDLEEDLGHDLEEDVENELEQVDLEVQNAQGSSKMSAANMEGVVQETWAVIAWKTKNIHSVVSQNCIPLVGKSFPHPVGVFCPHPEGPKCHIVFNKQDI